MKLLEVIQACHGRVSGGDPYLWSCYGENAQFMEFRDSDGKGYAHCIFDTNSYDVYEIHAEVPQQDLAYRWLAPKTKQAMLNEAKQRNVDPAMAWDDVKYIELSTDSEEHILNYLRDIGELCYENLSKE